MPLYVVPTTSYKSGYFALSTSDPSQNKNPYGAVEPAYGNIAPVGNPKSPTKVSLVSLIRPDDEIVVVAEPVPVPGPVATKPNPTVLETAPINVKSVVPTTEIVYVVPITKDPALTVAVVEVADAKLGL